LFRIKRITTCPPAYLVCADIAAATAAAAAEDDDDDETEADGRRIALKRTCTQPSALQQQAARAINDRQAEHMAFRVAQRSLTPINARRVA
jgi:hypothetical protein